jgi:hypothetical protein
MKKSIKVAAILLLTVLVVGRVFAGGGQQGGGGSGEKTLKYLSFGAGTEPTSEEQRVKPIFEKYYQETGVRIMGDFYSFDD